MAKAAMAVTDNPAKPRRLRLLSGRASPAAAGSLAELLGAMQSKLYAIAYSATGQREDALDLVQVAMTKLVSHYADRPAAEWPPLLMRILSNAITDHYRRGARYREFFVDGIELEQLPEPVDSAAAEPHQPSNPTEQLAASQLNGDISTALAALPERQRQAFLLRGWGEYSVAEAAEAMGCSAGSVKQHYFRALQALRPLLAAHLPSTTAPSTRATRSNL